MHTGMLLVLVTPGHLVKQLLLHYATTLQGSSSSEPFSTHLTLVIAEKHSSKTPRSSTRGAANTPESTTFLSEQSLLTSNISSHTPAHIKSI